MSRRTRRCRVRRPHSTTRRPVNLPPTAHRSIRLFGEKDLRGDHAKRRRVCNRCASACSMPGITMASVQKENRRRAASDRVPGAEVHGFRKAEVGGLRQLHDGRIVCMDALNEIVAGSVVDDDDRPWIHARALERGETLQRRVGLAQFTTTTQIPSATGTGRLCAAALTRALRGVRESLGSGSEIQSNASA